MTANKGTVYVIDDDADVRGGLTRLLRSAGWIVDAYAAAQDFLEAFSLNPLLQNELGGRMKEAQRKAAELGE